MKLSLAWLRELVDLPADAQEICDRMTLLGLEVEAVEPFALSYPGVRVGLVLEARPHPGADRLRLCRVATGEDEVSVVCGATNVRAGLKVALALPGAVLPGGVTIRKSKIRGEHSAGMICSERELGLGAAHEGILELPEGSAVGRALDELFGYTDTRIEVEVTPNRPDWLSHQGVARELAAFYQRPLRPPDPGPAAAVAASADGWEVAVEDRTGCPRYLGRIVRGVTVGPSPLWLRLRLLAIGQRPINAVVDASNLVLHELGHPNHVFDLARLHGRRIVVRQARGGERITTLDGVERALASHHLVIADEQHAVALAGVMGGAGSQVDAGSTDLLLEAACFHPGTIRRMRRELGLSTDASYRFERGVDFEGVPLASRRLAALIVQVAGGAAAPQAFEGRGAPPPAPARFFVRASQIRRLLGIELAPAQASELLARLSIEASPAARNGEPGVEVVQPSFRPDLLEEVDALEEIARHHGYDRIPVHERPPLLRPAERTPRERLQRHLRATVAARGYREVAGSSFMEAADCDRLGLPPADPRRRTVTVLNPLVTGEGHLRTTSLPELLRVVGRNRRRGIGDPLRLFQLDRCFVARAASLLPDEPEHLVMLWEGPAQVPHASVPARAVDLLDALGEVDALLESLGVRARRDRDSTEPFHAVGQGVGVRTESALLGTVGVLAAPVLAAFELDGPVVWAELSLAALLAALPAERRCAPLSPFPPVRRDLSLVAPAGVSWGAIAQILQAVFGALLESHDVFDLYAGEGLPAGARAIGVRLVLRSFEGTLKDRKVDGLMENALAQMRERCNVTLRA